MWNWLAVRRDERSLKAHKSVLGHLQHVATEDREPVTHPEGELIPHVRVLDTDPAHPSTPPPAPARRPLRPARPRPVASDPSVATQVGGRASARSPRTRRIAAGAGAVIALAAIAGVALAASGGHGRRPGPTRAGSPAFALPTVRPQVSSPTSAPTHPAAPAPLTPTSTGISQATYTVSAPTVVISLSATNSCWVELRSSSASGALLYQGVMTAGTARSFAAPGLWMRIGYPEGVNLEIDGSAVSLPASGSPFNVTVVGASPA
jgi:RodZ C-terminal domain